MEKEKGALTHSEAPKNGGSMSYRSRTQKTTRACPSKGFNEIVESMPPQAVRKALDRSTIINNRHWLQPSSMRVLLQGIGADYHTVCRYLPDKDTIRDGKFITWMCIEGVLEVVEKIETGRKLWSSIPCRNDKRANGRVSTANYD